MSNIQLFAALWTVAHRNVALLSMGFSRQEYWVDCHPLLHCSGLPFSTPGSLPDPGIKPTSHVSSLGRWIPYYWHHLGKKLESIIQSEVSQEEKDKYCILMYIYMELRHMVPRILDSGQQGRHRCKEHTFELSGRRQWWNDLREQH